MIVYGDPSTQESVAALFRRLKKSLSASDPLSLDDLRGILILAGMLEQAVEDGLPELAPACRIVTDRAADAFVRRGDGRGILDPEADEASALVRALRDVPRERAKLNVKVPEGFAFYALYPEAYIQSARRWLDDHPDAVPLVVGVRSIGTTLSAVVASTLHAESLECRRLTLRPTGHPFAREAHLEGLGNATHVLVVDEGPGLSGSSMAAVAEAARRAGIPRERIAFLPGHGGEPGRQASDAIRDWWRDAPRYVTLTESLRWNGLTLEETLVACTEGGIAVEELTGGRWRALAYGDESEWPPLDAPFERRKLLVRREDGSALLWKFVGSVEPLSPPGERGRGEGKTLGFQPCPWIEGEFLTSCDATPERLAEVGRYIAAFAGPPLRLEEAQASSNRLVEMTRHNAWEAGIVVTLPQEREWEASSASGGDDRLAPWEWRRLRDGRIVKAGRPAPTGDHTMVGRQPIEWDVAAAIVEWGLDDRTAQPLLQAVADAGVPVDVGMLRFYRAAYAAFRLGMTVHCAMGADPKERERLARAETRYRTALAGAQDGGQHG